MAKFNPVSDFQFKNCYILLVIALLYSCTKITDYKGTDSINVKADVKEWYYAEFKKTNEYASSIVKQFPNWDKAVIRTWGDGKLIEFPLTALSWKIPLINKEDLVSDQKRIINSAFQRMAVFIDPSGRKQVRIIAYIPNIDYLKKHEFDASNNTISEIDEDFGGLIIIKDWAGKFISGREFQNGKVIRKLKIKKSESGNIETISNNKVDNSTIISPPVNLKSVDNNPTLKIKQTSTCTITYDEVYEVSYSGHMEGDIFVMDDYSETFVGIDNIHMWGDCNSDPFDPCEIFECYTGGTGGTPPQCPSSPTIIVSKYPTATSKAYAELGSSWGITWPDTVELDITACNVGNNWKAIVTIITGRYSLIARLIPGVTEVTGPFGNTTNTNYCAQMTDLNSLACVTCPTVSWYMQAAVQKHEEVHETHFFPAITSASATIKQAIESLSVPYVGQDLQTAVTQIKALPSFAAEITNAYTTWFNDVVSRASLDHNGPTDLAERNIVTPMIQSICTYSRQNSLPVCGTICQ